MQSHDFASTYVGTPFYMSPEICAAERYTLYSDIWAAGCIMYELCQKQPPFNAKTHIQLVQRIREGKYAPLPDVYSSELKSVIGSCLKVNPDHRPDTSALLDMPVIRLMRKEKEVVDLGTALRSREEVAVHKVKEMELKYAALEKEKAAMKAEIENTVRREWEVKARLEIDRQIQIRLDELRQRFESEVEARVSAEVEKQMKNMPAPKEEPAPSVTVKEVSQSSATTEDTDFPSTTDLSELSLQSPTSETTKASKKGTRTPFSRSKTTLESPMDVQMGEPSPMSIASLSLSPRRSAAVAKNIFAEGGRQKPKFEPSLVYSDDEDDIPDVPSPTRPKVRADPLKAPPRPLLRQNTTTMMQKLGQQPSLFPSAQSRPSLATAASHNDLRQATQEGKPASPKRRLSKIPSSTNLSNDGSGSPGRKGTAKQPTSKGNAGGGDEMFKAVMQRNMGGRTLVELAQARAGGRPVEDVKKHGGESRVPAPASKAVNRDPPATWDPEKDDMPSPFLARGTKVIRNLR